LGQPQQTGYVFLVDGDRQEERLTYGELDRAARGIANHLRRIAQPGARVLLLYPPGLEFISGFFGCLYAGMIAVPAFPPSSARNERATERLDAIVRNATPAAILTTDRSAPLVRGAGFVSTPLICSDTLHSDNEDHWIEPVIGPECIACLQYTSGSTAAPKGVMLSHRNLLHNSATIAQAFEHTIHSVGCNWLPPYHDMGLIGGVIQPLFVGFPDVLMSPAAFLQKPLRWLSAISRYRATTCGAPDFAYDLCARSIGPEDFAGLDLRSWDLAFCGAEPIRSPTLERFAQTFKPAGFRMEAFYPCYGLAEATLMVTGGRKANAPKFREVPADAHDGQMQPPAQRRIVMVGCGTPRSDHDVRIVDPDTGREAPADTIGEIWVAGGGVAQGYWNEPEQTTATFGATLAGDNRRFLRTGDLGRVGPDGELFVTGRIKDLIILRGVKHHAHDIEHTVQASHPALEGCVGAAFSIEHDGQERLVITHELQRSQRKANPDEIIGAVRARVATEHHVQPHAIVLLKPGQIRRTSSGKVQRHACRTAYLSQAFESIAQWAAHEGALRHEHAATSTPATASDPDHASEHDIEQWLIARLAQALDLSPGDIEPTEPFARYGLDSANAVTLAGDVAEKMQQDLPATLFWDHPTVRSLAAALVLQRRSRTSIPTAA
jgi:acyl-CoA synthetase (AMP-forming)/AMP-acid ligase II/acyl carrier protein